MPRPSPPPRAADGRLGRESGARATVHQIKVVLWGVRPTIWRRLQVESTSTLRRLHAVLQTAFAWEDCHLHEFQVGSRRFGKPHIDDGFVFPSEAADEAKVSLQEVARRKGAKLLYVYDFGDTWEHEILVEDVLPADPGTRYPRCLDGRRAAPPEDCGGVWGYAELLRVLGDPAHEEHAERREWLGDDFDPEFFDLAAVNRALTRVR